MTGQCVGIENCRQQPSNYGERAREFLLISTFSAVNACKHRPIHYESSSKEMLELYDSFLSVYDSRNVATFGQQGGELVFGCCCVGVVSHHRLEKGRCVVVLRQVIQTFGKTWVMLGLG